MACPASTVPVTSTSSTRASAASAWIRRRATGPVDGPPTEVPMSLPDPSAGLHAALGATAALYRLRTVGVGADMECSMVESWISALPWGVLTTSAEGRPPRLIGTRDERMAPHGTFPSDGAYEWVAVAV